MDIGTVGKELPVWSTVVIMQKLLSLLVDKGVITEAEKKTLVDKAVDEVAKLLGVLY